MDRLTQHVWLGSASEGPAMVRAGVTTLVDLRGETTPPGYAVSLEHFPLQDLVRGQNRMLAAAAERVQTLVHRGETVGIYCQAGVSRTAAVAILYLVLEGATLEAAEAEVRSCRPLALPAVGLMESVVATVERWAKRRLESVMVEGVTIHAEHYPGTGPSLLLLHGVYGSVSHWDRVLVPLTAFADVWAIDLPGYGASDDWPEDFTFDRYLAVINEAIRALVPSLDILGGYSFGAFLAVSLLHQYPDTAQAGVLVSLTGRLGDPGQFRRVEGRRFPPEPSLDDRLHVIRENLRAIHLYDSRTIDEETIHLTYDNIFHTRLGHSRLRGGSGARPTALEMLGELSMPLLMVWGHHDPYCQPTVEAWATACREANSSVTQEIILDASHWCHHEHPERLVAAVAGFVQRNRVCDASWFG